MSPAAMDPDTAFALLSNGRRRQLLCLLLLRDGEELSLRVAARGIVGRFDGVDPDAVTDETARSVYVSLYQTHAPRLAAEGVVHYDEAAQTIRLVHGERTWTVLRLVDVEPAQVDRDVSPVVGVTAIGTVALLGVLATVDAAWLLPWGGLVVTMLLWGGYRYRTRGRPRPVSDCGDLTDHGSAAGAVDDGPDATDRQ